MLQNIVRGRIRDLDLGRGKVERRRRRYSTEAPMGIWYGRSLRRIFLNFVISVCIFWRILGAILSATLLNSTGQWRLLASSGMALLPPLNPPIYLSALCFGRPHTCFRVL